MNTAQVLVAAAVALVLGLGLLGLGLRPRATGERFTLLVFSCLLLSTAITLVVFAAFPTADADGTVLGISIGGALAGLVLLWSMGVRFVRAGHQQDELAVAGEKQKTEIARLGRELDEVRAEQRDQRRPVNRERRIYLASVGVRGARIGIVTGDIAKVTYVDIWVSSENTRMQMARIDEPTVSATVRYLGARVSSTGSVVEDTVHDALVEAMGDRETVEPGTVLATQSGKLRRSHQVMAVLHAAAVQGEPTRGFRQIDNVAGCVLTALHRAEQINDAGEPARSIIFPMLGTGTGRGDLAETARTMVDTAVDYLTDTPDSHLAIVWFLAFSGRSADHLLAAVTRRVGAPTEVKGGEGRPVSRRTPVGS